MEKRTRNLLAGGIGLILIFSLIGFFASGKASELDLRKGDVAVVSLDGSITSSSSGFGSSSITPSKVRDLNERALNSGADAIIYEINSGGGAVVASKDVKREIESVGVPTVCRLRDVAASGGYLISLGCNRTVADSASITGSIGVRSSFLEFSGLLNRLGVEYVNITSGKLKGVGSPYRNITPEERRLLKQKSEMIHREFINLVEKERNLSQSEVEKISTGEIFLGSEAKKLELVDKLGGRQQAVEEAENLTGHDLKVKQVDEGPDFSFLDLMGIESFLSSGANPPLRAEIG